MKVILTALVLFIFFGLFYTGVNYFRSITSTSSAPPERRNQTTTEEKTPSLLAPPQDTYRKDSMIMEALQFLSRQWQTNLDSLYVLAIRKVSSEIELGIVDSSSFSSARLLISNSSAPELQKYVHKLSANRNVIYLVNEFKPKSPQEMKIAQQFYAEKTPSLGASQSYAVVFQWDVGLSGYGNIQALTSSGYLTVPVEHDVVLKRLSYYAD